MSDKRGSSGAQIIHTVNEVFKIKVGDSRVVAQGRWLQAHPGLALPRVRSIRRDGYTMEPLYSPPMWALDHTEVLLAMLEGLDRSVWYRPPVVTADVDAIRERMIHMVNDSFTDNVNARTSLRSGLLTTINEISWGSLRGCLTHGDTTFDNVMFRGEQLVIIDPIPAETTVAVPDLWSSDVGHVLRSALGFERVRYGDDFRFKVSQKQLKFYVRNDNEWLAASFWAVFHLLRTLPYQRNDSTRKRMKELICDAANRII